MTEEFFREIKEPIKGLEECSECKNKIVQDIFLLPKEDKRQSGRLIEARACGYCKIIYEIIDG